MTAARGSDPLNLPAIEARLNAATPGPWAWAHNNEKGYGASVGAEVFAEDDTDAERPLSGNLSHREDDYLVQEPIAEMAEEQAAGRNAEFIAAAPDDVRALLAALRDTRKALREATLDEMTGIPDLFAPRGGWEAWDERARGVLGSVVDG